MLGLIQGNHYQKEIIQPLWTVMTIMVGDNGVWELSTVTTLTTFRRVAFNGDIPTNCSYLRAMVVGDIPTNCSYLRAMVVGDIPTNCSYLRAMVVMLLNSESIIIKTSYCPCSIKLVKETLESNSGVWGYRRVAFNADIKQTVAIR